MTTITELAKQAKVTEEQIRRRYRDIPGITKGENGELIIPDGTRYPARKLRNITTQDEKLYALLKAISEYRYIDEHMLAIPVESFNLLINELLAHNWIQPNGINNPYGANGYDATLTGSMLVKKRRKQAVQEIANVIGGAAGAFAGNMINAMNQ